MDFHNFQSHISVFHSDTECSFMTYGLLYVGHIVLKEDFQNRVS